MNIRSLAIFLVSLCLILPTSGFTRSAKIIVEPAALTAALTTPVFTSISAGGGTTCALTSSGGLKCWGFNTYGQVGDGTIDDRFSPVNVSGLTSGVLAFNPGKDHTCAVTSFGGVKCWGANYSGQLGDGTKTISFTPVDVIGLSSGVIAVGGGEDHSCALTSGGAVYCWGDNYYGQLGDGSFTSHTTPTQVTGLTSGIVALSVGDNHSCVLTTSDGAKCWGNNYSGKLGDGTTNDRNTPVNVSGLSSGVAAISAGTSHSCAVTSGGGVKCWGYNKYGQLGDSTTTTHKSPADVSGLTNGVKNISSGGYHTCALTTAGGVKCWGDNVYGQLGDNSVSQRNTPVNVSGLSNGVIELATGFAHTCALGSGGGVKCWGLNTSGQLSDGTPIWHSIPLNVGGLETNLTALTSGWSHLCALTSSGGVKCWGNNWYGQLGDGSLIQRNFPVAVTGLSSDILAITSGGYHNCALTSVGGIECWGQNGNGQLGDGTTIDRSLPVDVVGLTSGVLAVKAGGSRTCAVTSVGGIKCWGSNWNGQLGDGTTIDRSLPVDVVGLTSGATAVSPGISHTCALTSGGGVKCWGDNDYGELGNGTNNPSTTPVDVSGLSSGVAGLTAGGYHSCVVTNSGGAKCWGDNYTGALGDGTQEPRNIPVDVIGLSSGVSGMMGNLQNTCAITTGGGIKCWGDNWSGRLGDGTTHLTTIPVDVTGMSGGVTSLAIGKDQSCALVTGGRAKCWGSDRYGQLGLGTITSRLVPVDVVESMPVLSVNYSFGQPGSYFTLTGENYPPNSALTITANGFGLPSMLQTNETGGFIFFLTTSGASPGWYQITATVNPGANVSFYLESNGLQHPQEGGGTTLDLPAGLGIEHLLFLPLIAR